MSVEPTSSLTNRDLILEVARKIGFADYGVAGDAETGVPLDEHDLAECQRHVNNAIRMFLHDAPRSGWRFARPTAQVTIWGDIGVDSDNKITSGGYDPSTDRTTLNVASDSFYETMEGKTITLTGVDDFTIAKYVSAQQIKVMGDATGAGTSGVTWSISADGNYTLPRTFGGQYSGAITYTSDTNQGVSVDWVSEATIRQWRENITDETGDPFWAAVRPQNQLFDPRRRWELMVYPQADEVLTLEFPFDLHFDQLVDLDEVPPVPFSHDETIKAACLAIVEKDVEEVPGPDWTYYTQQCLPNSYRVDSRAAPKDLGYFGNPRPAGGRAAIRTFREQLYERPNITYDTSSP